MDTYEAAAHPLGVPEPCFTGDTVQRLHAVLNAMSCGLHAEPFDGACRRLTRFANE